MWTDISFATVWQFLLQHLVLKNYIIFFVFCTENVPHHHDTINMVLTISSQMTGNVTKTFEVKDEDNFWRLRI